MALKISLDSQFGLTISDAHAVIKSFMMKKEKDEDGVNIFKVKYSGVIYVDATAYADNRPSIESFHYYFMLDTDANQTQYNVLKQCYLNLKTQEGFTDGVDV